MKDWEVSVTVNTIPHKQWYRLLFVNYLLLHVAIKITDMDSLIQRHISWHGEMYTVNYILVYISSRTYMYLRF